MKKTLNYIRLGLHNLPGYGEHPGTLPLCLFILMGGLASASRDWHYWWIGSLAIIILFVPMYLIGAYERGKEWSNSYHSKGFEDL